MGIEPMHCGFADRSVTTSPLHLIDRNIFVLAILFVDQFCKIFLFLPPHFLINIHQSPVISKAGILL